MRLGCYLIVGDMIGLTNLARIGSYIILRKWNLNLTSPYQNYTYKVMFNPFIYYNFVIYLVDVRSMWILVRFTNVNYVYFADFFPCNLLQISCTSFHSCPGISISLSIQVILVGKSMYIIYPLIFSQFVAKLFVHNFAITVASGIKELDRSL